MVLFGCLERRNFAGKKMPEQVQFCVFRPYQLVQTGLFQPRLTADNLISLLPVFFNFPDNAGAL